MISQKMRRAGGICLLLSVMMTAAIYGCRTVTNTQLTMRMMMREYLDPEKPVYPKLDDKIFGFKFRMTGILNPRQFADEVGFWIFMTEPHRPERIPVVFVHGHFGGPSAFKDIANAMDRERFEPWFAFYPSGLDIHETADMFRQNLARTAIRYREDQVILVAMSMGGLVVREALKPTEDDIRLPAVPMFIGVSNPWGGSRKTGTGAGFAVVARPGKKVSYGAESWQQFEAGAPFIKELYNAPIPDDTDFHIIYGVGGDDDFLPGRDDGSLSEDSLARPEAVRESKSVTIVEDGLHSNILSRPKTIARINELLGAFVPR